MAQIKKIVKPGDLIRGAKVGVAGLDKTGNVIGVPGITVPAPAAADQGKALIAGSAGPVWQPVAGVTSLYYHPIAIYANTETIRTFVGSAFSFLVITTRSSRFTSWSDLLEWARNNSITYFAPASGSIYDITAEKRFIVSWIDVKSAAQQLVNVRGYYVDDIDVSSINTFAITDEDGDAGLMVYDYGVNQIL